MTGGSKIRRNPIMMTMSPVGSPTSGENISDSSNINNNNNYSSKLEQDRFLPIANVSRIMKRALPPNAKISKEAKETVQECVSEFISFITGEASDKCQREKRKTINGDDLLWAMTTLGFENYVSPLKIYLNNYRETEGEHTKSSSTIVQEDQHIHSPNRDTNTTTTYHHHHLHHHRGAPEIENFAINSGFYNNSITNIVTHNDAADANLRYRVQW